jgi:hypothetical protein
MKIIPSSIIWIPSTHTQKHGLESLENTQEHKEKLAYVQLFVSFKNISIHDDAMTKLWDFQTP